MAKDPAFLFYPNDYIGGTMGMTFEEKGAYMELLMMQFNRGHMTSHMIGQTIGQLWDTVKVKFTQDDKGLWYNVRLEEEQDRRRNFTDSRKNNRSGKNQYTNNGKKDIGHMTSHMENVNVNKDNKDKRKKNIQKENIDQYKIWADESSDLIYKKFVGWLLDEDLQKCMFLKDQVDEKKFNKLYLDANRSHALIKRTISNMENKPDLIKKYTSFNRTLTNWVKLEIERKQ